MSSMRPLSTNGMTTNDMAMNQEQDGVAQARAKDDSVARAALTIEHLFAQGVGRQQAGALAQAERFFRNVLAVDPNHVGSLHHLGIIALQTGRHESARNLIARAITLNDSIAECHYHFGLASALLGDFDACLVHNRRAIELNPDYADAHLNLGNALKAKGELSQAAAAYERVLALRPSSPEAHYNLANVLSDQGRFDAAIASYRRAIALRPDYADAHNNLGTALIANGDIGDAVPHYQRALALKPARFETYTNLASALLANGDTDAALGVAARALSLHETGSTRMLFVQCVRALQSVPLARELREHVLRALEGAWGPPGELAACATALVKRNEAVRAAIERAAGAWPKRLSLQELLGGAGLPAVASDRLFLKLLESTPPIEIALEKFLTSLRCALLEIASSTAAANEPLPDMMALHCALARQCFINEYVFGALDEEWEQARRLRAALIAALESTAPIPSPWLAAVACYFPLYSIPGADRLLERSWPDAVAALLVQQIREPAEERQIRASIPALTIVEDEISIAVRQQYEENPYPRWVGDPPPVQPIAFDHYIRRQFPLATYSAFGRNNLDILIAGCGTGRHSIAVAQAFSEAKILAIDLSLSSLAYAKRKSLALGLRNIEYAHADILELGSMSQTFDVIDSIGVLHHIAEPWNAWKLLLSLLRPGGCMRIGLYSAFARRDVEPTMRFIATRGYGRTADDIRRCRQELMSFADGTPQKNVTTCPDFFSTSECRDYIFHVQQQATTIPKIKTFLDENALEFLGFELDAKVLRKYAMRFPDDRTRTNLDSWHVFETENPDVFAGMYVFLMQKRC
jgi:tetratricopeptide (TPR) repeat protein/SAM-dependent methyltransferase